MAGNCGLGFDRRYPPITNGLVASESLFRANNRIKKLDLSVNGGEPSSVQLPDPMSPFDIKLADSGQPVRTVRLTIRETDRGARYQDPASAVFASFGT